MISKIKIKTRCFNSFFLSVVAFYTIFFCALLIPFMSCAFAEEFHDGPFESPSAIDEVFNAPGLTGDWGGLRTQFAEQGLQFSLDFIGIVQSVMDGGFDETTRSLGSSEFIIDVDGEKLGLWPGFFARFAAQGRFGRNVLNESGALSVVSKDALFPADPDHENKDTLAITEMNMTQFLTPWLGIYGGLLNTTSGDANEFSGFVRSQEHFQNLSLLASMVSARLVPNVTLGGGIILIPTDNVVGTVTIMNTEESAGSNPFNTADGQTLVTEWTVNHDLLDLPVRHVISFGLGFNQDFFKFGDYDYWYPDDRIAGLKFGSKDESWAFWYNGQLAFWTHPTDADRQMGFFVRFGYADDETNFIEWNLAGGIGGVGLFDMRPRDRFGFGVYHLEPSDKAPLPAFGIKEETGAEIFYTVQLSREVAITADLQYVDSGQGNGLLVAETPDNAWVGGLRLRIVL
jgi:porin